MSEDPNPQRSFKVDDRRRFSETGEPRTDAPPPPPDETRTAPPEAPPAADQPAELTFLTFVLGLSTEALAYLGEMPHPLTRQVQTDLRAAKHFIDILGLLQDKTRGNLDRGEADLLERVLYDLRIKYVERVRTR
ncbi:DUF1844 domain-containing protein [Candidatus Binatia bacterium]|nr:DUF1844 domain-containing protein [Candidatus Binatia bacterium]